jgi:tRNA threonylcarbamoyl adenosine modification protein YjeE
MSQSAPLAPKRPISFALSLADLAATDRLGAGIARRLRPGDILALEGPLGVGKTRLARAILAGLLGAEIEVPSPTFTLLQTYETALGPLYHFDLYRLTQPEQAYELGIEEAFAGGISLIEWPQRLGGLLPPNRLDLSLDFASAAQARRATLTAAPIWADRDLMAIAREVER